MAGTKPLSWKWKLLIAFVALCVFSMGFFFSPWGFTVMLNGIKKAYTEAPEDTRRTHESADWYLSLAWYEGNICGREQEAMDMYEEFIAIRPGPYGTFFDSIKLYGPQWSSEFFDVKKKTGWGPLHERAPEAYYEYLLIYQNRNSSQHTTYRARVYYTIFCEQYPWVDETSRGNPHKKFYKYWKRINTRMIQRKYLQSSIPAAPPMPPGYEGPIE